MNASYISTIDKIDQKHHRSHVILHLDYQWYFGEFENMEQLQTLADTLGFGFALIDVKPWHNGGTYCKYSITHKINSPYSGGFWRLEDLPADVKPIKALSNGSIVTCYYTNDGETIRMYRPNPNSKNVYIPLSIEDHIKHVKKYGSY